MGMFANQFAQDVIPCSTSTENGVVFGFQARAIKITNDRAAAVFVNLGSSVATTNGFRTCSGETVEVAGLLCSGLGLSSTTTSTSAAVRVGAWGA